VPGQHVEEGEELVQECEEESGVAEGLPLDGGSSKSTVAVTEDATVDDRVAEDDSAGQMQASVEPVTSGVEKPVLQPIDGEGGHSEVGAVDPTAKSAIGALGEIDAGAMAGGATAEAELEPKAMTSLAGLPTIGSSSGSVRRPKPMDSPRLAHKPVALLAAPCESIPPHSQSPGSHEDKETQEREEKRAKKKSKSKREKERGQQGELSEKAFTDVNKENKPVRAGKKGVKFDSVQLVELACYVHPEDLCSDGGPAFHLGAEEISVKKVSLDRFEKKRSFTRISFDQYGMRGRVDANTRRSSPFM